MYIICSKCLRKHLALAKSFMREVLDGHGEGANPDHRPDIEGEITNAEEHASMIDPEFTLKLRFFRRTLQQRKFMPCAEDMETIDMFYYITDKYDGAEVNEKYLSLYSAFKKADTVSNVFASSTSGGCGCSDKKS